MYAYLLLAASFVAADPLPDGTLLFLENCNKFVETYTEHEIGHVAMIVNDGTTIWVYEATPDQVRRMTLADYYTDVARLNEKRGRKIAVLAHQPKKAYSAEETAKMRAFLDERIGQRYSLRNYVRKNVRDGTHCAELTANMLNTVGRYKFAEPSRITPGGLRDKIIAEHQPPLRIELPAYEVQETWCERADRSWHEWYIWCSWGCGEAWSLCF